MKDASQIIGAAIAYCESQGLTEMHKYKAENDVTWEKRDTVTFRLKQTSDDTEIHSFVVYLRKDPEVV